MLFREWGCQLDLLPPLMIGSSRKFASFFPSVLCKVRSAAGSHPLSMYYKSLMNTSFFAPLLIFNLNLFGPPPGPPLSPVLARGGSPRLSRHSLDLFPIVLACRSTCTRCDRKLPRFLSPTRFDSSVMVISSPDASALHIRTRIVSFPGSTRSASCSSSPRLASARPAFSDDINRADPSIEIDLIVDDAAQ